MKRYQMKFVDMFPECCIHESSYIESSTIGRGTYIWHFCHVYDSIIGDNCVLGQNVMVGSTNIGNNCRIQNNVSIYEGVILGNHVFVGPSVVFTNVLKPKATAVGERINTHIHDRATIGANATIVCGVTIGEGAFIGAGAVVTKDVPAGETWVGNPAKKFMIKHPFGPVEQI